MKNRKLNQINRYEKKKNLIPLKIAGLLVVAGLISGPGTRVYEGVKGRLEENLIQQIDKSKRINYELLEPHLSLYVESNNNFGSDTLWTHASKISKQPEVSELMKQKGLDNQCVAGALRKYLENKK
jgi:hypothetical protein